MARRPITVVQRVSASVHDVWALLATPGHLARCHPFCRENVVTAWPGPGSRDEIEYHNGRQVVRTVNAWLEGEGFDLTVFDENGPAADVSWRVGEEAGGSTLTITLVPRMFDGRSAVVQSLVSPVIRVMLARYLRSVARGVDFCVTRGEPVRRNQFGSHIWFSRSSD